MQAMRQHGLTDVLTNDHHFEQEGFRALFRNIEHPSRVGDLEAVPSRRTSRAPLLLLGRQSPPPLSSLPPQKTTTQPKPPQPLPQPKTIKQNPILPQCSMCGAHVRLDRLAKHTREKCPHRPVKLVNLPSVDRPKASRPAAPSSTKVPRKALPLSSPRFLRGSVISGGNTKPVYLDSRGRPTNYLPPSSRAAPFNTDSGDQNTDLNEAESRRLDGSRNFSQYGDDGKFGSHPSFDNLDDESCP